MLHSPYECFAAALSPVRGTLRARSVDEPGPRLLLFAPDTATSEAGSPDPSAMRVLVVEDSLDVAETLQKSLTAWGYAVNACTGGNEALALAPYFRPDVVLIDIGLPDMDGWQLARRLRAQGDGDVPVMIAITALGEEADFERSRQAGISFHLVKPAFQTQLRQLLERIAHDR